MKITKNVLAILVVVFILVALAWSFKHNFTDSTIHSPYAGQEARGIKALSQADVEGLLDGSGTPFGGMAKPAELNGYPGPRHVLDAIEAGEFEASGEQKQQIEALYGEMKEQAINLGKLIIDAENELDKAFKNKTITPDSLGRAVAESTDAYSKLRVVHLKYHLQMVDILSEEQVVKYNELRGYTKEGGPCANMPEGHDAKLWKLHNNCE